jgi:hypothetical protein
MSDVFYNRLQASSDVENQLALKQDVADPPTTFPSTWYWADTSFYAKTVSVAADRYTLLSPNAMQIDIGGTSYTLTSQATIDLSLEATWDTISGTFTLSSQVVGLSRRSRYQPIQQRPLTIQKGIVV